MLFDGAPADLRATGRAASAIHDADLPRWLEDLGIERLGTSHLLAFAAPWPFDRDYMRLALIAGLVVGACAPLIGAFLVEKRMSLLGDGLGHLAFAGVAIGLLARGLADLDRVRSRPSSARSSSSGCAHTGTASGDLALAMFFYGGIALAVVLASKAPAGTSVNVLPYLFGSILTVTSPTCASSWSSAW